MVSLRKLFSVTIHVHTILRVVVLSHCRGVEVSAFLLSLEQVVWKCSSVDRRDIGLLIVHLPWLLRGLLGVAKSFFGKVVCRLIYVATMWCQSCNACVVYYVSSVCLRLRVRFRSRFGIERFSWRIGDDRVIFQYRLILTACSSLALPAICLPCVPSSLTFNVRSGISPVSQRWLRHMYLH